MKKIVVLTGSFNPITKAHRILLESAVKKINADFGLFVITNDAYLTKKNLVDKKIPNPFHLNEKTRQEMIDNLKDEFPNLLFGGHELGNESPSTERTLRSLAKKYKDDKLYFMIGSDKLKGISHWKNADKLFNEFDLIVFKREGYDVDKIISNDSFLSSHKDCITILEKTSDTENISSTLLRNKFFNGEDYSCLMDKGPYEILRKFSMSDFPSVSNDDVIKATFLYGGRFAGNKARLKVYHDNLEIFNNWDESIFGNKDEKINGTKVYHDKIVITPLKKDYETKTDCLNEDCASVANMLKKDGLNPAILNLASNIHPCGGYDKGANAQEESLCYMSTLSLSLYQFGNIKHKCIKDANVKNYPGVYPLDINFGGIYSPKVTFFRNNIDKYYSLREKKFDVGVISVSSLSNRMKNDYCNEQFRYFNFDGTLNAEGLEIEKNKIRSILRIALDNNHDSIVLGAFGCGVYNLLAGEVSKLFYDCLNEIEFKNQFKKIVFAIFEGKGSKRKIVGENGKFKPFYDLFKQKNNTL